MKTPKNTEPDVIVLATYSPENYPRVRALALDGGGMEETFYEWKMFFDAAMEEALKSGIPVRTVEIHPDAFSVWLSANNFESTPGIRAKYATILYSKRMDA